MFNVEAFASPKVVDSTAVSELIAAKYFDRVQKAVVRALTDQNEHALANQIASLQPCAKFSWRCELGVARATSGRSALAAALQLIVVAPHSSLTAEIALQEKETLLLDGHLIPIQGEVRLCIEGDKLRISSAAANLEFKREKSRWSVGSDRGTRIVNTLNGVRPGYLIEATCSSSSNFFPSPLAEGAVRLSEGHVCREEIQSALDWISAASPAYRRWITSVIDGAIVVGGNARITISSSDFPGLIAFNAARAPVDYVELLVSAACHQKLFQLALIAELTATGVEDIHYLPHRRAYTTVRRALASAHEHVNVLLALQDIRATDAAPSLTRTIERRRLMVMNECAPVLDRSDILTATGRILWGHLRELLLSQETSEEEFPDAKPNAEGHESAITQMLVASSAT